MNRCISVCLTLALMFAVGLAAQAQDRREERPGAARPEQPAAREQETEAKGGYWIGLECGSVPKPIQAQLDVPDDQGLIVNGVIPDGPAARAGVREFDVLLTVNDKPLAQLSDLISAIQASDGRAIELKLIRGGKTKTVEVKPERRPQSRNVVVIEEDARGHDVLKQLEGAEGALRMRFFHPGMLLPPGAPRPPFPDDLSLSLSKQGNAPAKIEVRKGEQSWTVTEDELDKLPENVRGPVLGLLGRNPLTAAIQLLPRGEGGQPGFHVTAPLPPVPAVRGDMAQRIERQLREMRRELDELRDQMEDVQTERSRRRPDRERNRFQPDREDGRREHRDF